MEVILVENQKFEVIFKRSVDTELTADINFKIMSTVGLNNQLKGGSLIESRLASALKTATLQQPETRTEIISTSITIQRKGQLPSVWMQLGGEFLSNFSSKYQDTCSIRIHMSIGRRQEDIFEMHSAGLNQIVDKRGILFGGKLTEPVFRRELMEGLTYKGKMSILLTASCSWLNGLGQRFIHAKVPTDLTLSDAESGAKALCHGIVLGVHSSFFENLASPRWQHLEIKVCEMELKGNGLDALIDFIYFQKIAEPIEDPTLAVELLQVADSYNISSLEYAMRDLLLRQENAWFSIDSAITLYLTCRKMGTCGYDDLKWKALKVLKARPGELHQSNLFGELLEANNDIAVNLVLCGV